MCNRFPTLLHTVIKIKTSAVLTSLPADLGDMHDVTFEGDWVLRTKYQVGDNFSIKAVKKNLTNKRKPTNSEAGMLLFLVTCAQMKHVQLRGSAIGRSLLTFKKFCLPPPPLHYSYPAQPPPRSDQQTLATRVGQSGQRSKLPCSTCH